MRTVTAVENLPAFFGKAYDTIIAQLNSLKEQSAGMPFGAYYNMDMSALDREAGFPVSKVLPASGEIKCSTISGRKYVSTAHRGAYDSVSPAYEALNAWAKENNYEPTGIAYEYYLNDPNEDPSIVAETEIRLPLK